jgi:hypothetical protein
VNIDRLISCRRLPRFVIKCVGVVCDVYMLYLKCMNIIQVFVMCFCVLQYYNFKTTLKS